MIRAATVQDIPDLARVYVESFREADPSEKWSDAQAHKLIEFFLNAQPDMAFLVEKDRRILAGICGLVKPWWDGNHLVDTELFVAPASKDQGIGSALLLHYLRKAVEAYDARIIEAITFKNLEFPASWYLKLGLADKQDWKVISGDVQSLIKRLE